MLKKIIVIGVSLILILSVVALISLNYFGGKIIDKTIDSEVANLESEIAKIAAESGVKGTPTKDENLKEIKVDKAKLETDKKTIAEKQKTVDKLKSTKSKISAQDRMTAAALVARRLSPSDIAKLESMLVGGMDAEKRKEAIALAYARFTPAEIAQLKELYAKYMN